MIVASHSHVSSVLIGNHASTSTWTQLFLWPLTRFSIESKDEVFHHVQDLILTLENERHRDTIRAIRNDNGTKLKNSHFYVFAMINSLNINSLLHMSLLKMGLLKRKNQTLVEMARTMLKEHETLRKQWAEVMNIACYILNSIFLKPFLKITSYELMHGCVPKISHLSAFGCKCSIWIKEIWTNLSLGRLMVFSWVMHTIVVLFLSWILKLIVFMKREK